MKDWKNEKEEYYNIEIPEELHTIIEQTITYDRKFKKVKVRRKIIKFSGSFAAAIFLSFVVGVNSSYVFAKTANKIPVVKTVAKALIVRDYTLEIAKDNALQESLEAEKNSSNNADASLDATGQNTDINANNSVSGSDTVSDNDLDTVSSAEEWASSMTIEELNEVTELYTSEMDDEYADQPEKLKTILLAYDSENDIYLYGYHENGSTSGVIVRIGDAFQYFDWIYMSDEEILPEIAVSDYDDDGDNEVAVLLHYGEADNTLSESEEKVSVSGNDVVEENTVSDNDITENASSDSIEQVLSLNEDTIENEDLWIVNQTEDEAITAVRFSEENLNQLLTQVTVTYDSDDNSIQLYDNETALGKEYNLANILDDEDSYLGCKVNNQVTFEIENGLQIELQIGIQTDKEELITQDMPVIVADLLYEGDNFSLDDLQIQ